jgi:phosphoenolpyruvate-protein kinase (PTS system EI component)
VKTLQGIAASRGIAIGPVFHFRRVDLCFDRCTVEDSAAEWARFQAALETAGEQLADVYAKAEAESGAEEASIFQAHAMMLDDPELLEVVQTAIEEQHINAESALSDAAEMYAQMLESLDDEYLSARAADVRDVATRVLRILLGVAESPTAELTVPSIILARDLTPSDTVMLDKSLVLGFCTAEGGATSHTAILARGLGLPAVVGAGPDILGVPDGATLVLDGNGGTLLVDPDEETVAEYRARQTAAATVLAYARQMAHEPAITLDGHRVEVVANIGNVEGAQAALGAGAEGVGLLRTEFLYLERAHLPDEEEQYRAYRAIVDESLFGPAGDPIVPGAPRSVQTATTGGLASQSWAQPQDNVPHGSDGCRGASGSGDVGGVSRRTVSRRPIGGGGDGGWDHDRDPRRCIDGQSLGD